MTNPVWVIEQITVLAECYRTSVTEVMLRVYADALCDLPQSALAAAIGKFIRQSKFFPSVAELRELAGGSDQIRINLEAEAAWQKVEIDLSRHGIQWCPRLDARTEYAIRCTGGRRAINDAYKSSDLADEVFAKKRFFEAFNNYDAAHELGLAEVLPSPVRLQLPEGFKALPGGEQSPPVNPSRQPVRAKQIPNALSDDELLARRAQLREQAAELARKYPLSRTENAR